MIQNEDSNKISSNQNLAIVYLRLLACIMITNSHMRHIYPSFLSILSFGGHLGNTLFFFVSGWCLTSCLKRNVFKYSIKRILRLYIPYLIIMPMLLFQPEESFGLNGAAKWKIIFPVYPYHFICSMLILSILFYFSTFLEKWIGYFWQSIIILILLTGYTFLVFNGSYKYNTNFAFPMICCFFIVMLLGGCSKKHCNSKYTFIYIILAAICFCAYIIQSRYDLQNRMQFIQLIISIFFAFFIGNAFLSLEKYFKENRVISFCSNLTLEIYLVQGVIISAFENISFPINFVFAIISIISSAYCLNFIVEKVMKKINDKIKL